jgi:hypothetical protein
VRGVRVRAVGLNGVRESVAQSDRSGMHRHKLSRTIVLRMGSAPT